MSIDFGRPVGFSGSVQFVNSTVSWKSQGLETRATGTGTRSPVRLPSAVCRIPSTSHRHASPLTCRISPGPSLHPVASETWIQEFTSHTGQMRLDHAPSCKCKGNHPHLRSGIPAITITLDSSSPSVIKKLFNRSAKVTQSLPSPPLLEAVGLCFVASLGGTEAGCGAGRVLALSPGRSGHGGSSRTTRWRWAFQPCN